MARTLIFWVNDTPNIPDLPVGTEMIFDRASGDTCDNDDAYFLSKSAAERIALSKPIIPDSATGFVERDCSVATPLPITGDWIPDSDNSYEPDEDQTVTPSPPTTVQGNLKIGFGYEKSDKISLVLKAYDPTLGRFQISNIAANASSVECRVDHDDTPVDLNTKWFPARWPNLLTFSQGDVTLPIFLQEVSIQLF